MREPRGANKTLTYTEVATFGLGLEWTSWIVTSKERTRGVLSRGNGLSKGMEV